MPSSSRKKSTKTNANPVGAIHESPAKLHTNLRRKPIIAPSDEAQSWRCHDWGREKLFVFLQVGAIRESLLQTTAKSHTLHRIFTYTPISYLTIRPFLCKIIKIVWGFCAHTVQSNFNYIFSIYFLKLNIII